MDITKKLRTENEEMSRQRLSLQEELKDLKNKVENTRSEMEFKNMKLKKAEEREQQIQEKNQRREIDYAKVLKNMEDVEEQNRQMQQATVPTRIVYPDMNNYVSAREHEKLETQMVRKDKEIADLERAKYELQRFVSTLES